MKIVCPRSANFVMFNVIDVGVQVEVTRTH